MDDPQNPAWLNEIAQSLKLFNFLVQIPESEDGGSLLGSSKRSLADTSVTSTADLSIFSGGDRRPASQQKNENGFDNGLTAHLTYSDIDLNNVVGEDDAENGESSPKWVFFSSRRITMETSREC